MAIDDLEATEVILQLEKFCERLRPEDEKVRKKLVYGYTIDNQSVILNEIRPDWFRQRLRSHIQKKHCVHDHRKTCRNTGRPVIVCPGFEATCLGSYSDLVLCPAVKSLSCNAGKRTIFGL